MLIAPFALLLALIGLSFLLLAISLVLEFPLLLAAGVGLAILGRHLRTLDTRPRIPCEQN